MGRGGESGADEGSEPSETEDTSLIANSISLLTDYEVFLPYCFSSSPYPKAYYLGLRCLARGIS
jgi:hypothetical protein